MGLQTSHGLEQESATSVQEGTDGTVTWGGAAMSIKYSNADDSVTAEVWKTFLGQRNTKFVLIMIRLAAVQRQRSTHACVTVVAGPYHLVYL